MGPILFLFWSRLFAHKSLLEPIVAWFERKKKHSWDAQDSDTQIMVSDGRIGCPFMPDLLFKFHLSSIV